MNLRIRISHIEHILAVVNYARIAISDDRKPSFTDQTLAHLTKIVEEARSDFDLKTKRLTTSLIEGTFTIPGNETHVTLTVFLFDSEEPNAIGRLIVPAMEVKGAVNTPAAEGARLTWIDDLPEFSLPLTIPYSAILLYSLPVDTDNVRYQRFTVDSVRSREHKIFLRADSSIVEAGAYKAWLDEVRQQYSLVDEWSLETIISVVEGELILHALREYPGNVLAAARVLEISERMLRQRLRQKDLDISASPRTSHLPLVLSSKKVIAEIEGILIQSALEKTVGNRTRAASLLGISHRTILYKMKEYGIS